MEAKPLIFFISFPTFLLNNPNSKFLKYIHHQEN